MIERQDSRRKPRNKARERHASRQRRQRSFMSRFEDNPGLGVVANLGRRGLLLLGDGLWYVVHQPRIMLGAVVFVLVIFGLYVASYLFSGRIFPNVWAFGVPLGDLTVDEAEVALQDAWNNRAQIKLTVDDQVITVASPAELGMQIDARSTVEAARNVGMSGIPFGYSIQPQAEVDYTAAQNYLLNVWSMVHIPAYNAGYTWQDGQLVGEPGKTGRELDVVLTLERLIQDPVTVAADQRLHLLTQPVKPDVSDPSPFLEQARQLVSQPIRLTAYDPFVNESLSWTTTQEEFTRWLAAGQTGLTIREDTFLPFLQSLNASLNSAANERYLDPDETIDSLQQAMTAQQTDITLRMRYYNTTYTVVAGDTGQGIARKTGLPFYLIEQANPGRDLNILSIDDHLTLPSYDLTLPEPVVPNKRIIVDLDRLTLTAFENGQEVFRWKVSSGRDEAPTSPGIYQILTHDDIAIGSGAALCGEDGRCGEWRMHWFMGIYQVSPGLINGFHGAVELPNGAYLAGGNVGGRDTYGCLMSEDSNARKLYEWAEIGTVVEIISREFQPRSQLAQQVRNNQA